MFINLLSDAIAYSIIAILSFYQHFLFWGDDNWDPTQQDRIDEATEGNYVARWRYKMNQMLGGTVSKQEYIQTSANWQGCLAGCGCFFLIGLVILAVLLYLAVQ